MIAKSWAIKLATEAARTVLSVDQIIVARQAGGPKPPGPNPVSSFLLALQKFLANDYFRTGMRIRFVSIMRARHECIIKTRSMKYPLRDFLKILNPGCDEGCTIFFTLWVLHALDPGSESHLLSLWRHRNGEGATPG